MDVVQFVSIEDDDDLVLGLSFPEGTEFGIGGFIIQRTPKFEFALFPHERGASIDWTADDERILVKAVHLSRKAITVTTQYDSYAFDLSKIPDEEYQSVINILNKMNFDGRFKFTFAEE